MCQATRWDYSKYVTTWVIGDATSNTPWVTYDPTTDVEVVFTLEPTDFNVFGPLGGSVRYEFNGALTKGRTIHDIIYPAIPDVTPSFDFGVVPGTPIYIGVEALNDAIHSYAAGTKMLGVGHSLGAEIIGRWLANHAGDVDAPDPADLSFVQIGNPERKYGGIFSEGASALNIFSGGHHTPTDTQYTIIDAKVQYDLFADWPTGDTPSPEALANIMSGIAPHAGGYVFQDFNDPNRLEYQEGNTTFVMYPNDVLSLLGVGTLISPLFGPTVKPLVEASYDRPER